MIKIVINGAGGRMGKTVSSLAFSDPEFVIVGGIEAKNSKLIGKKLKEVCGLSQSVDSDVVILDSLEKLTEIPDALIDFSEPKATLYAIEWAAKHSVPSVIGTTGFSNEQKEIIRKAAEKIPILLSSNMSYGMNVIFKFLPEISKYLNKFDTEIIEIHHKWKKDSPSGTALTLAEKIGNKQKNKVFSRYGVSIRKSEEIGIFAVRGGDVVGDHCIMFLGEGERLEIVHRATSREAFAKGALIASKIIQKFRNKPGLLSYTDIL